MHSPVWGEMRFQTGFKAHTDLEFLGRLWNITVKLQAYRERDGMTEAQEDCCNKFARNREDLLKQAQSDLLNRYPDADSRFIPQTLLFNRDGSCALLLEDAKDVNDGLAIQLLPLPAICSQDEYL